MAALRNMLNMAVIMEAMGAEFGTLREAANQARVAVQMSLEKTMRQAREARRGALAQKVNNMQKEEEVAEEMDRDRALSDTRE